MRSFLGGVYVSLPSWRSGLWQNQNPCGPRPTHYQRGFNRFHAFLGIKHLRIYTFAMHRTFHVISLCFLFCSKHAIYTTLNGGGNDELKHLYMWLLITPILLQEPTCQLICRNTLNLLYDQQKQMARGNSCIQLCLSSFE